MSKDFNSMKPWGMLARCVVNPDHSVAYFLHPENSNLKADGTPVDWEEVEELGQNVMVQIPKFYYVKKWVEEQQAFIFGVTDKPVDTDYVNIDEWEVHPAFFRDRTKFCDDQDANPVEVDYRYVGAFHGWVDGKGRLRSLPGKLPTVSKTIGDFRNHAKNMGVGWSQFDYYLLYAIQMLYITEYGHPDSQTMIGRGFVDGNSSRIETGGTLQYGNNTFGEATGKQQMSYRGIEDLWGNVLNWIDGLYSDTSYNILIGNKGFNDTGQGYKNVGKGATSSVSGNIRTIPDFKEAGFIIKTTDGSSNYNTGLHDYGYLYLARFPNFGGHWSIGSAAGAFRLSVDSSGSGGGSFGARLSL